ncbi:hypothetical protein [Microbacterium oleivorans]|uniref:hypothetical protein n=1 Tax=Microbacterium oleivorans TaxID=273677 RepID=UPI00204254FD|nr:hypothetical protein [Microbacterium oleivorans]MCM3696140.1 hypothetical protein [Microbacterium oleivorans]
MPRRVVLAVAAAVLVLGLPGCATAAAATPDEIAERVSHLGVDPVLVVTTTIDGYDLAPQSVNETDEGGMTATWSKPGTGDMITVRTGPGEMDAAACAAQQMWGGGDATCVQDGGTWRRSAGRIEEYAVVEPGRTVLIVGGDGYGAPSADLREAAAGLRAPTVAETDRMFAELQRRADRGGPVERGDLPDGWDGAPIDPGGEGG